MITKEVMAKKPTASRVQKMLGLDQVKLDGGTQSRSIIDSSVAGEYSEDIADGATFPPVTVFYDGSDYWLADGFHRHAAHVQASKKKIAVDIRQGSRRDAILFSVGANATHGLKRTREDKRRAVETLLHDEEWSTWSDREIARRCAVSHELVRAVKAILTVNSDSERTYRTKHGTVSTMDITNIGRPDGQTSDAKASPPKNTSDKRAEKEAAKADKAAKQAENDRRRDEHAAALPQAIKDSEQAKKEWRARAAAGQTVEALAAEVDELREANASLETELATVKADHAKWETMRVQYMQGGFDKIIAGKDEEIRVLLTRVEAESRDKVLWANKAKFWKDEAIKFGWTNGDFTVDIETGEVADA